MFLLQLSCCSATLPLLLWGGVPADAPHKTPQWRRPFIESLFICNKVCKNTLVFSCSTGATGQPSKEDASSCCQDDCCAFLLVESKRFFTKFLVHLALLPLLSVVALTCSLLRFSAGAQLESIKVLSQVSGMFCAQGVPTVMTCRKSDMRHLNVSNDIGQLMRFPR